MMKLVASILFCGFAAFSVAQAGLADQAKSAVKVTKPSATISTDGVEVVKPGVELKKPELPEIKKPTVPEIKKPEVEVTKPSATISEKGVEVVKPGIQIKK